MESRVPLEPLFLVRWLLRLSIHIVHHLSVVGSRSSVGAMCFSFCQLLHCFYCVDWDGEVTIWSRFCELCESSMAVRMVGDNFFVTIFLHVSCLCRVLIILYQEVGTIMLHDDCNFTQFLPAREKYT